MFPEILLKKRSRFKERVIVDRIARCRKGEEGESFRPFPFNFDEETRRGETSQLVELRPKWWFAGTVSSEELACLYV